MSRSYNSSPPSAFAACSGTALAFSVETGQCNVATFKLHFIIPNERAEFAPGVCIDRLIYILG
jgi:hypothetical protein